MKKKKVLLLSEYLKMPRVFQQLNSGLLQPIKKLAAYGLNLQQTQALLDAMGEEEFEAGKR